MTAKTGKRLENLDIAKGIGMFLVLWAHARGPHSRYIVNFHMPFFFLVSGYLHNSKYDFLTFTKKKAWSLYIPFVFWNYVFYIVRRIITDKPLSFETAMPLFRDIALTLEKDSGFGGATWFLGALFSVAVLFKLAEKILPDTEARPFLLLTFWTIAGIFSFTQVMPHNVHRTIMLGMFYGFGVFVRTYHDRFKNADGLGTAVIAAVLYVILSHYNTATLSENKYTNPFLFVIGACLASYALIYFSGMIARLSFVKYIKNCLLLMGRRSIDILIWHFWAFFLVSMAQAKLAGEQVVIEDLLRGGHRLYDPSHGKWFIFVIAGAVLPLLWGAFLRAGIWGKALKKIHLV